MICFNSRLIQMYQYIKVGIPVKDIFTWIYFLNTKKIYVKQDNLQDIYYIIEAHKFTLQ